MQDSNSTVTGDEISYTSQSNITWTTTNIPSGAYHLHPITLGPNDSASAAGIFNPIFGFARYLLSADSKNTHIRNGTVPVTECAMYLCVQTYNLSVADGDIFWDILHSWRSDSGIDFNSTVSYLNPPQNILDVPGKSRSFAFQPATLKQYFSTQLSFFDSDGEDQDALFAIDAEMGLQFFLTNDLSSLMGGLALSMTNALMNNQTWTGAGTVNGTAYRIDTFIHVRQPWFTLPVSLVLFFDGVSIPCHAQELKERDDDMAVVNLGCFISWPGIGQGGVESSE